MKNKSLLMLFSLSLSTICFGQTSTKTTYTDDLTRLINWISNIDDVLTKITDKERLKRIYRQLGYASEDIDNVAIEKQDIADKLSNLSVINESDINAMQPFVDRIIEDILSLNVRLDRIKTDISQTDISEVEKVIESTRRLSRKNYFLGLNDIKGYLFSDKVSLSKLRDEVKKSTEVSNTLSEKLKEAKAKIRTRMNER